MTPTVSEWIDWVKVQVDTCGSENAFNPLGIFNPQYDGNSPSSNDWIVDIGAPSLDAIVAFELINAHCLELFEGLSVWQERLTGIEMATFLGSLVSVYSEDWKTLLLSQWTEPHVRVRLIRAIYQWYAVFARLNEGRGEKQPPFNMVQHLFPVWERILPLSQLRKKGQEFVVEYFSHLTSWHHSILDTSFCVLNEILVGIDDRTCEKAALYGLSFCFHPGTKPLLEEFLRKNYGRLEAQGELKAMRAYIASS